MKQCNKCLETKAFTEFFKDKNNKTDGYYSICKPCKQTGSMKWREANREQYNENQRKHHKKHALRNRLYRYDITPEQYNQMLQNQNGVCALCSNPPTAKRALATDHDHTTKEVRGLLCYKCNRDMATVDNKEHLTKLLSYRDKKHRVS